MTAVTPKEMHAEGAPADGALNLIVDSRAEAGEGVALITLKDPEGAELPEWTPGAHIDLVFSTDANEKIVRQYSLCGSPNDKDSYTVGILNVPDGRGGSSWIHENLTEGRSILVNGPRNNFTFDTDPDGKFIFVAAGIGVTPLIPMAHAAEEAGKDWVLIQLSQNLEREALGETVSKLPSEKVERHYSDSEGFFDFSGYCRDLAPGSQLYACGPPVVLDILDGLAKEYDHWDYHFERFVPIEQPSADENEPFEVTIASTGDTFIVPAEKSCLEILRENGFPIEWSCKEGVCGTCEVDIVEGEAIHRDSVLSEDEREAGETMMVCVSRAKGAKITIDL